MFYEIGLIYLENYRVGLWDLRRLNDREIPRNLLSTLYYIFLKHKMILAIEELGEKEKREWWNEAKEYCAGLNRKETLKVVKSIYALNKLAEMSHLNLIV